MTLIHDINTSVSQIVLHVYKIYKMGAMSTILQYSFFLHRTHQYNTTIQLLPTQDTSVQYYDTALSHRTHQCNTTIQLFLTGQISTILQYSFFSHKTHQYNTTIQLLLTQDTSVQYYDTAPSHTGHISTIL